MTETIEESGTSTSPTRLTARSTTRSTATRFQRFSTARMTPTRDRETSQTESVEEDVRKLTSGSRGFETTGKTTEPKPTDMLFEKSKVPEIPTRSETGQADEREIGNASYRDRRSGSNIRFSKLVRRLPRSPARCREVLQLPQRKLLCTRRGTRRAGRLNRSQGPPATVATNRRGQVESETFHRPQRRRAAG